jgi:hypothetical protein
MEASRPDAPIKTASEDRLGRASFVRQLARALIRLDGSASGGVVGLTGEWGSGKSSVLNLLEEQISIDYKDNPIIVRFNPWLVSGRDDLIASFFNTFADSVRTKIKNRRAWDSADQLLDHVIDAVARYGGELSPLVNIAKPGLGTVAKLFSKMAEPVIKDRTSLRPAEPKGAYGDCSKRASPSYHSIDRRAGPHRGYGNARNGATR